MSDHVRSRGEAKATYVKDTGGLVADALVEDVEVAGHGQGDDCVPTRPGVPDLLEGHTRAERPGRDRLAGLDVPCGGAMSAICEPW